MLFQKSSFKYDLASNQHRITQTPSNDHPITLCVCVSELWCLSRYRIYPNFWNKVIILLPNSLMDWRQRNNDKSRSVAVLSCTGCCTTEPTENDIFGKTLKFYTYRLVKYVQVSETTLWGVHSIIINWENMLCPVCCFVDYFSLCQWTLFQIVQYILEYSPNSSPASHTIKQNVFKGFSSKSVHTSKNMWYF